MPLTESESQLSRYSHLEALRSAVVLATRPQEVGTPQPRGPRGRKGAPVRHVAQGEAIEVIGPNVASNPLGSCLRRGGDDEGTSPTRTGPSYSWALKLLIEAREHPFDLLARHAAGDWGELCAFDHRQNELALRYGYRVLSSYDVPAGRVWIITEADRSVTTILLPEDY